MDRKRLNRKSRSTDFTRLRFSIFVHKAVRLLRGVSQGGVSYLRWRNDIRRYRKSTRGQQWVLITGKESYVLPSSELYMTTHLIRYGEYQMYLLESALKLASESGALSLFGGGCGFIDAGANVGTTCIPAVSRFGFDYGFAFECNPSTYRALEINVRLNGLESSVDTHQVALGSGSVDTLFLDNNWEGNLGASYVDKRPIGKSSLKVKSLCLDDFWADFEWCKSIFLWIDCEGWEAEILRGASRILTMRPPVVIEFAPTHWRSQGVGHAIERALSAYREAFAIDQTGEISRVTSLKGLEMQLRESNSSTDLLFLP